MSWLGPMIEVEPRVQRNIQPRAKMFDMSAQKLPNTQLNLYAPRWPVTVWMSRMFMIPPTLIFTLISLRFILAPAHAIAAEGVSLTEPEAVTDTRVIGALVSVLAILVLSAIFSRTRLRLGHFIVVLTMGLALCVRFYGFLIDGTTMSMGDQAQKTIGEIVFLVLNSVGLVVQTLRLRPAP